MHVPPHRYIDFALGKRLSHSTPEFRCHLSRQEIFEACTIRKKVAAEGACGSLHDRNIRKDMPWLPGNNFMLSAFSILID